MKFTSPTQQYGHNQEQIALRYLQQHGLKLIEQNYQTRFGEIDLIMLDDKTIVFTEVRARSSASHGNALSSITKQKQQKIIHTATIYLQQHQLLNQVYSRFDVVSLDQQLKITWIKSAFMLD